MFSIFPFDVQSIFFITLSFLGSESSLCDKYSGQCPCKRNVAGRKCDRCATAFFGFGADGCQREFDSDITSPGSEPGFYKGYSEF